jgi:hypothetical protein
VALSWMVTGQTVGGLTLYPEASRLDRATALRLYTQGSAWMSGEEAGKGALAVGQLGDLAVLSADYFEAPAEEIRGIESVLTVVGGKVVHGAGPFDQHDPPALPVMPDWSPVATYGGYYTGSSRVGVEYNDSHQCANVSSLRNLLRRPTGPTRSPGEGQFWGTGCACWAF